EEMNQWTGFDLILDLYRLHYSGSLALRLIPANRLQHYEQVFQAANRSQESSEFIRQLRDLGVIFHCFLNGKADADFEL
ncbi:MAG: metallophosphoesterase, partial [Bacteroidales bacterium]|nr:metallophosphoesterase [Candidatus Minthousia equi]